MKKLKASAADAETLKIISPIIPFPIFLCQIHCFVRRPIIIEIGRGILFIDGNPYGHLVWGDGNHNLAKYLKALKDNGYTGLLSQELTDDPYYSDPFFYDQRNMKNLLRYME